MYRFLVPVLFCVLAGAPAGAQNNPEPAADQNAEDEEAVTPPPTFLDSVTVTATLRPAPVRDTPGTVSVIDAETIQERLVQDAADLVKYEPGVYIENHVTRLGLNGFNIRGIGGNRVMTLVDGVQAAEQFDFGVFSVHQTSLDVDALQSVEIVRSANSALYGSDAVGGVVSLFTKDPADYLRGRRSHLGAKVTWDGRADGLSGNVALAGGGERLQGSLFASANRGHEIGNQGAIDTRDARRTVPNPQDVVGTHLLGKVVATFTPGNVWRMSVERYDTRVETDWLSDLGRVNIGLLRYVTTASTAVDTQSRNRLSVDHTLADRGLDLVTWRIYGQTNDTGQVVDRDRVSFGFGPPSPTLRHGTLDYTQAGWGATAQGQQRLGDTTRGALLTFGGSYRRDRFDVLRDRTERHAVTGVPAPTDLIFPTKYFPESTVEETGAYVQAAIQIGRVSVVPGVRVDRYSLDANQRDPVFLASLNPEATDFVDTAISPKLGGAVRLSEVITAHAQYAAGFRAPPHSAINTGFASTQAGYITLPNPELRAETSDNLEAGLRTTFARASVDATIFTNRYDHFIELTTLGVNRATRLLEFQSQNLEHARIDGVELRGEAYLTSSLMIRGGYAWIDGVEIPREVAVPELDAVPVVVSEMPLESIAPNEGVVGIRYIRPSGRWGTEVSLRLVESRQAPRAQNQFSPDAYTVVDLTGFVTLADDLRLRLGVLNLTDATYFEWWNIRGRPADDPAINRYSSPGMNVIASLGYDW